MLQGVRKVAPCRLRAVRTFSAVSNRPPSSLPSTGTLGGVIIILNVGGFGFAAYQCEQNPQLDKRVAEIPLFGDAVGATKGLLRTMGVTKEAAATKNFTMEEEKKIIERTEPPVIAKKEKKAENDAKKNMKALVEASRVKKDEPEVEVPVKKDVVAEGAKKADTGSTPAPAPAPTPEPEPVKAEVQAKEEKKPAEEAVPITTPVAVDEQGTPESDKAVEMYQEPPVLMIKDYSTLPPVPSEARIAAISADANQAVADVMDELNQQTVELRKELEATLLKDLDKLDAAALRTRCTQLAAEFFERTKWEGVRLHSNVKQIKGELSKKYQDRMAQQRAELELELNKLLLEREQDLMTQASIAAKEQMSKQEEAFEKSLREQAQGFTNNITIALEKQAADIRDEISVKANNEITLMRDEHVQQQMRTLQSISDLSAKVDAFDHFADKIGGLTNESANMHKFSAAVLSLESALQRNGPMANEVTAVKSYCDDPLVQGVTASLPKSLLQSGAPSFLELKIRFAVVKDHVRQSAFAPEGLPEVVGQAIGSVLSKLYWAPTGPVDGSGAEEVLSRATYHLESGKLDAAVKELEQIGGYGQTILRDWKTNAQNRLLADQAAKALRAHSIVRHHQMSMKKE